MNISLDQLNTAAELCATLPNELLELYCLDGMYMSFGLWSSSALTLEGYCDICSKPMHQNDRCFARLAQRFNVSTLAFCASIHASLRHHCVNGTASELFLAQSQLTPDDLPRLIANLPEALIRFCRSQQSDDLLVVSCVHGSVHGLYHTLHYRHFIDLPLSAKLRACSALRATSGHLTSELLCMHHACTEAARMFVDLVPW